jgi:predicted small metal-binding protein
MRWRQIGDHLFVFFIQNSNCDFVAKGETEREVLEIGTKHVKEVHGYTDEQLTPEFLAETKRLVKTT